MLYYSYRLLTFNANDESIETDETDENERRFRVQMFGINDKGGTASIFVEGYTPFFFVKVGDDWTSSDKNKFIGHIRKCMGDYYSSSIKDTKLVQRKKLYGFDGGKEHTFIEIHFETEAAMRKAKSIWYTTKSSKKGEYKRELTKGGFVYN